MTTTIQNLKYFGIDILKYISYILAPIPLAEWVGDDDDKGALKTSEI